MNLVIVARRPRPANAARRSSTTSLDATRRDADRLTPADPDGPSWFDANIRAHCVVRERERASDVRRDDLH